MFDHLATHSEPMHKARPMKKWFSQLYVEQLDRTLTSTPFNTFAIYEALSPNMASLTNGEWTVFM